MDGKEKQILRRKVYLLEEYDRIFTSDFLQAAINQGLAIPQQVKLLQTDEYKANLEQYIAKVMDMFENAPGSSLDKVAYLLEQEGMQLAADELLAEKALYMGGIKVESRLTKEADHMLRNATDSLIRNNPSARLVAFPSGRRVLHIEESDIEKYLEAMKQTLTSRLQVAIETMKRQVFRKQGIVEEEHRTLRTDMFDLCKYVKNYMCQLEEDLGEKDFALEGLLSENSAGDMDIFHVNDNEQYREVLENDRMILTLLRMRIKALMDRLDQISIEQDIYMAERRRCFMILQMSPDGPLDENLALFMNSQSSQYDKTRSELMGKSSTVKKLDYEYKLFKSRTGKELVEQQKKVDYLISKHKNSQRSIINYQSAMKNAREAEENAKDEMEQLQRKVQQLEYALKFSNIKSNGTLLDNVSSNEPLTKPSSAYSVFQRNRFASSSASVYGSESQRKVALSRRAISAKGHNKSTAVTSQQQYQSISTMGDRPGTGSTWRSESKASEYDSRSHDRGTPHSSTPTVRIQRTASTSRHSSAQSMYSVRSKENTVTFAQS